MDTNAQAAELSAQQRARLVEYGQVDDERTAWLASTGNRVGSGDLIQTRLNAWHLNGYRGNTRAAFNRDEFLVTEVLEDGGLRVAPLIRGTRQPAPGETMVLPASYVRDWVVLGYAATVHSSQGLTVDSSHLVATQNTSVHALYVAMTRGRVANTAHVVTQSLSKEAEYGQTAAAVKRTPLSVLRAAFELDDPQLSALQAAAESATEADRLRTPAELLADGIALVTAGRTARWLDELADAGVLTADERTALAVEDGAGTLQTLLRRVELAGQDPRQVVAEAIQQRSLHDARRITHVIQDRIKHAGGSLDPLGDTYTERLPQVDDPKWADYLGNLAAEADARAAALGEQVAEDLPQWAAEAFDRPPSDAGPERDTWIRRAGTVAAHREVIAHDASDDALGKAPKPGQVEQYASWRAAWRALGRPEADRAEAEDVERPAAGPGPRLRTRKGMGTALRRGGTRRHPPGRRTRTPHRRTAPRGSRRERRRGDPRAAPRRSRTGQGTRAGTGRPRRRTPARRRCRAVWWAHTAETRANAERAEAELEARGIDNSDDGPTPEELLDTIDAEAAEDEHREVTDEHELADIAEQRDTDTTLAVPANEFVKAELISDQLPSRTAATDVAADEIPDAETVADDNTADTEVIGDVDAVETVPVVARAVLESQAPADIREVAAGERPVAESDVPRVPSADETAEAVRRAQRALIEIQHRREAEARHAAAEAEARAEELVRWHADGTNAEHANTATATAADHAADDHGPVMELGRHDDE